MCMCLRGEGVRVRKNYFKWKIRKFYDRFVVSKLYFKEIRNFIIKISNIYNPSIKDNLPLLIRRITTSFTNCFEINANEKQESLSFLNKESIIAFGI